MRKTFLFLAFLLLIGLSWAKEITVSGTPPFSRVEDNFAVLVGQSTARLAVGTSSYYSEPLDMQFYGFLAFRCVDACDSAEVLQALYKHVNIGMYFSNDVFVGMTKDGTEYAFVPLLSPVYKGVPTYVVRIPEVKIMSPDGKMFTASFSDEYRAGQIPYMHDWMYFYSDNDFYGSSVFLRLDMNFDDIYRDYFSDQQKYIPYFSVGPDYVTYWMNYSRSELPGLEDIASYLRKQFGFKIGTLDEGLSYQRLVPGLDYYHLFTFHYGPVDPDKVSSIKDYEYIPENNVMSVVSCRCKTLYVKDRVGYHRIVFIVPGYPYVVPEVTVSFSAPDFFSYTCDPYDINAFPDHETVNYTFYYRLPLKHFYVPVSLSCNGVVKGEVVVLSDRKLVHQGSVTITPFTRDIEFNIVPAPYAEFNNIVQVCANNTCADIFTLTVKSNPYGFCFGSDFYDVNHHTVVHCQKGCGPGGCIESSFLRRRAEDLLHGDITAAPDLLTHAPDDVLTYGFLGGAFAILAELPSVLEVLPFIPGGIFTVFGVTAAIVYLAFKLAKGCTPPQAWGTMDTFMWFAIGLFGDLGALVLAVTACVYFRMRS